MKERPVLFGTRARLVGVVTLPPHPRAAATRPGIILINAGLIHRVGPNRVYVRLARSLAAQGYVVLRFDLSGIGDSPARLDGLPFSQSAQTEVGDAAAFLSEQYGVSDFLLAGICTGAVVAYRAALDVPGVRGTMLINAQGLIPTLDTDARAYIRTRSDAHYYMSSALFSAGSWLRLFSGRVDYRGIARAVWRKAKDSMGHSVVSKSEDARRVAQGINRLVDQGKEISFFYSGGDPGIDELHVILGLDLDRLRRRPNVSYSVLQTADHLFTRLDMQTAFVDYITNWVLRASGADSVQTQELALGVSRS